MEKTQTGQKHYPRPVYEVFISEAFGTAFDMLPLSETGVNLTMPQSAAEIFGSFTGLVVGAYSAAGLGALVDGGRGACIALGVASIDMLLINPIYNSIINSK